jgi:2'-5' RNA ligase
VAEKDGLRASWVQAENMHLTLHFLGEALDDAVPSIEAALRDAASDTPAFDAVYHGAGAFPSPSRPRVLWAGVTDGQSQLADLARRVGERLAPLGYPPEDRPFSPHLTLARIKEPRPAPHVADALKAAADRALGRVRVGRVVLFQSVLKPGGPVYTPAAVASLSVDKASRST